MANKADRTADLVPASTTMEPRAVLQAACEDLAATVGVLAVFDAHRPDVEGVLAAAGRSAAELVKWCDAGASGDDAWLYARRAGHAMGTGSALGGEHFVSLTHPAALDGSRVWFLALGRGRPFDERDGRRAAAALRHAALAFEHVTEAGLGRLIVSADDRLLHADPQTLATTAEGANGFADLLALLRAVIAQRWGQPAADDGHDAVLPTPAGPRWVRFQLREPVPGLRPQLWLEVRPVSAKEDPPAVGLVEDVRVAQALGFLADRYHQAPSLNRLAEAVQVSPFHFHRLFTRVAGTSPKHYLLRTQLMVAKWLLRTTNRPIREVAADTGFASHGHFTATFHRAVGVSPTTYRERGG